VRYFPALVNQNQIQLSVNMVGSTESSILVPEPSVEYGVFTGQTSYETANKLDLGDFGLTVERPLGEIIPCCYRKQEIANIS
jgi:hypothetical protein